MVGTLSFENINGDVQTMILPGNSIENIDTDARIILDLLDGVLISLIFRSKQW